MQITAGTDADMETFLATLGPHLGLMGASVTIDLYSDDEITAPTPKRLFEEMRQAARARHKGGRGSDPFMGVDLDLTSDTDVQCFALLAHRTIGCEGFIGTKLVFTTVENERKAWLDLPAGAVEKIRAEAQQAGATTLSIKP